MQYLLLLYSDEATDPVPGTEEFTQMMQGYAAFGQEVQEMGVMAGGNALESVTTATTVRVREGKVETSDGPFAETKEMLGGYYLLDCKDIDEALAYAAKIPAATHGSIEVRPVMTFE